MASILHGLKLRQKMVILRTWPPDIMIFVIFVRPQDNTLRFQPLDHFLRHPKRRRHLPNLPQASAVQAPLDQCRQCSSMHPNPPQVRLFAPTAPDLSLGARRAGQRGSHKHPRNRPIVSTLMLRCIPIFADTFSAMDHAPSQSFVFTGFYFVLWESIFTIAHPFRPP